jgi:hypothetical protein
MSGGRKPIGNEPMTAAQRKREQRMRQDTRIMERDSHEWTEADCLRVLSQQKWRGTVMDKSAWEQLGKLRGYG